MGLRQTAEQDLASILEDVDYGFGWAITLISPGQTSAQLTGFSNDIAQAIDPDTGMTVSGRTATIALRIGLIKQNFPGEGLPVGVSDAAIKPWIAQFNDINGQSYQFKVSQSDPDLGAGIVILFLEAYE